MRLAIAVVMLGASTASADPPGGSRRCYAGTTTVEDHGATRKARFVMTREADRHRREIREQSWHELDPADHVRIYHVDPMHSTFDYDAHGARVTGSFEGDAWSWTRFAEQGTAAGVVMTATGKLAGDALVVVRRLEAHGKEDSSLRIDAKAIPCSELAEQRAALDDTAANARLFCYEGTEKTIAGDTERVVFEQVIEPKRIRIVRWGPHATAVHVYDIDGTRIAVTNPQRASLRGAGMLTGSPGAWTGYAWKSDTAIQLAMTGTLGGGKMSQTIAAGTYRGSVDAVAFDCKYLVLRRDAVAP